MYCPKLLCQELKLALYDKFNIIITAEHKNRFGKMTFIWAAFKLNFESSNVLN